MRCESCHMRMVPFFICKKTGATLKVMPEITGCNIDGKMTTPQGKVVDVGHPRERKT